MNRQFTPRWYQHWPMYYHVPGANLQSYSPIPLREYRKRTDTLDTVFYKIMLRERRQGVWNLAWLTTPEVDNALQVTDEESLQAHSASLHPWFHNRYSSLRRLVETKITAGGRVIPVDQLLKNVPAREFWEHAKRDRGFLSNLEKSVGERGLAHAEKRAVEPVKIRVTNALLSPGHVDQHIPGDDTHRSVERTHEYRVAWLTRVTEYLRRHVESCCYDHPRVSLCMDVVSADRMGVYQSNCAGGEDNQRGVIGISPAITGTKAVLITLLHELAHAIAGDAVGHRQEFWDVCYRLGLRKTYSEDLAPVMLEVMAEIEELHDPYPGAVWEYEFPEAE